MKIRSHHSMGKNWDWRILIFFALGLFILTACASLSRRYPFHPPGVDNQVIQIANRESKYLFVDSKNEEAAEKLKSNGLAWWQSYEQLERLQTPQDTLQTLVDFRQQLELSTFDARIRDFRKDVSELSDILKIDSLVFHEKLKCVTEANTYFNRAYSKNPLNLDLILYLARSYTDLGKIEKISKTKNSSHFQKARNLLNSALSMDRGGHDIYALLSENYWAEEQWEDSQQYFLLALETLRKFEFLPENPLSDSFESVVDSNMIFTYNYRIAETYIKRYRAKDAIQYFEFAKSFGSSVEQTKQLEDYIRWLNWANGNIAAREKFDAAVLLESRGEYLLAAEKYNEVIRLLTNTSQNELWEASWRLSKIESEFLIAENEYYNKYGSPYFGMHRLRNVVQQIPTDSSNTPIDTTFVPYFNDLARMVWNAAEMQLNEMGDRHQARDLFAECAIRYSDLQAKACLRMTRLYSNAYLEGQLWAVKTFGLRHQLTRDEMMELDNYFKRVLRRPSNSALRQYMNERFKNILKRTPMDIKPEVELKAYGYLRSLNHYLGVYLNNQYGGKQDRSMLVFYERLYRLKERELPFERRVEVRNEIRDLLGRWHAKRGDEKIILDEWLRFMRTLGQRAVPVL